VASAESRSAEATNSVAFTIAARTVTCMNLHHHLTSSKLVHLAVAGSILAVGAASVIGDTSTATASASGPQPVAASASPPVNYLPTGSLTILDPDTVTGTLTFGSAPAGVTQKAEWSTYVAEPSHPQPELRLGEFGPSKNVGTTAVWTQHGQCDGPCSNTPIVASGTGAGVPLASFVKITNSTGACQVYTVTARISEGWMPQSGAATFSTTITNFGAGGYTHPNVTAPTCGSPIGADTHPAVPAVTPAAAPTPTGARLDACTATTDPRLGTPCWTLTWPTAPAHHANLQQWNPVTYEKVAKPTGGFWVGSAALSPGSITPVTNTSGSWIPTWTRGAYNTAGSPAAGRPTAYGKTPSVFTTWVKTTTTDFKNCKLFKVTISTVAGPTGVANVSPYTPGQDAAADPFRTISCP